MTALLPNPQQDAALRSLFRGFLSGNDAGDSRIYFVLDLGSNRVKIGRTCNLAARLATLRTAIPDLVYLGSFPGGAVAERNLHDSFAADRVGGEWFATSERLARVIGYAIDEPGDWA